MKLELGYKHSFEVRYETYLSHMEMNVLFISDLHLNGYSSSLVSRIVGKVQELDPDVILLGGDYVDSKKGFPYFEKLLLDLGKRKHVFAIPGNHDYFYGIDIIKKVVERNDITWLEDTNHNFSIDNREVVVTNKIEETEKGDFNLLCIHKPQKVEESIFDIVLAGHLHGGQFVFWETSKGLFPGRLFYKWNVLKTQLGKTLYIVGKGLGDTLPIRYNCKKELVMISVKK